MTMRPFPLWQLGFLVTAGFQWWRGAIVDALVFTSAAILMSLPIREPSHGHWQLRGLPRWARGFLAGAAVVFFATAPLQQHPNRVVIAFIGPLALWQAWTLPTSAETSSAHRRSRAFRISRLVWALWFLSLCIWEGTAYALSRVAGDERANPTVTVLVEPSLHHSLGRAIFAAAWSGFGLAWLFSGRLNE